MNTAAFRKTYPSGFSLEMPALELRPGELTAVIGANGSGKSTLARVLSGIERADGGARVLSGATVAYLPQKCYAFRMSVEKNILLGGAELQRFAELGTVSAQHFRHLAKMWALRSRLMMISWTLKVMLHF